MEPHPKNLLSKNIYVSHNIINVELALGLKIIWQLVSLIGGAGFSGSESEWAIPDFHYFSKWSSSYKHSNAKRCMKVVSIKKVFFCKLDTELDKKFFTRYKKQVFF